MPPRKKTPAKKRPSAASRQDESLESLFATDDEEEIKKPRGRKKKVVQMVRDEAEMEELEEIVQPAKAHARGKQFAQWCMSCKESIHWAGVGIFAAASLAAIILGVLLATPQCSRFMEKFLYPWKMPNLQMYAPKDNAEEMVSTTFIVTMDEKDTTNILARAVETDITTSADYATTGRAQATDARSTGTVKITNTTSRSFQFVATTRLESKEGVLFRLKSLISIPPNSSIDAVVVADQPGPGGDVPPTSFVFLGLSGDLRSQVYATSETAMSGGGGLVKVVAEGDISRAKATLRTQAVKEAIDNFRAMVGGGERLLNDLVVSQEKKFTAPQVDAKLDSFTASLETHFRGLIFPEAAVEEKLIAQYLLLHPDVDRESLTVRNTIYVVQAYDTEKERAEVRVEAEVIP